MIFNSGSPYNCHLWPGCKITIPCSMTGLHLPLTFPGPAWSSRASVLSIRSPTSVSADRLSFPINFLSGPDRFTLNLRLSKTFGFGPERKGTAGAQSGGGGPSGPFGGIGGGPRGGGGAAVEADAAVEAVASAPRATVATV